MIYDKNSTLAGNIDDPEFHQKIIDALPIPIFYRDTNGIYQMCNKAHEKFTGRSKANIIGKSVYDLHSKETAETYFQRDLELLRNPGEQIYETQMKRLDGSTLNVILEQSSNTQQ